MLRTAWHTKSSLALLLLLFCCAFYNNVSATPTTTTTHRTLPDVAATTNSTANNFKCPADCQCVVAATHHVQAHPHQFLHAKCSSLNGLKSEAPLEAEMPIHSVDLSYLSLTRLAYALDKLHELTSVDLSHNELHEFGHLSRRIKKLNLKHNRITSSKLSKLPEHLQFLNLQHNDITNLPLEFTKLTQLQTLELSHNPINCSCETLEVRNWLQERHVFMENAVKCSYPIEAMGKPWLQVKQADICAKEKSPHADDIDDNENELMLGDQPAIEGSAEHDDDEELGKDFMPVAEKSISSTASHEHDLHVPEDVEGSGDLSELSMRVQAAETRSLGEETTVKPEDDDEDGSGSGEGGIWPPIFASDEFGAHDDFDAPVTYLSPHAANDDEFDNKPVEEPAPEATPMPAVFHHQGIFDPEGTDSVSTDSPVQEEIIVPVVHSDVAASGPATENAADVEVAESGASTEGPEAAIMQAKVGDDSDSGATYFLLGVIGLIVLGLILFVGIKRCKQQRNRRHDAENPRQTELLDMDKKNLGKPLYKEHAPLIGDKTKSDLAKPINGNGTKPYDANDVKDGGLQNQPLLKNGSGNGAAPKDGGVEPEILATQAPASTLQAPHEYCPITPRYPTPKSPRASKYAQYPQGENNNNTINADDAYLPSSPKSGRYSPVYSPETGRVKIKLTETPRPKTPMLVTRSKSNAGDIITTPVAPVGNNNVNGQAAVGIHTGTNGHAY